MVPIGKGLPFGLLLPLMMPPLNTRHWVVTFISLGNVRLSLLDFVVAFDLDPRLGIDLFLFGFLLPLMI